MSKNNLGEINYITDLTFDEIKSGIIRKRNEHLRMTNCYKKIYSICENIPEKSTKKKLNDAINEIMEISSVHKDYWEWFYGKGRKTKGTQNKIWW